MGFSSYSQVVTPAKWVNPLDLNMVYKDISHKDDIAKQNLDELQQISTQLSSIPAFGVDSEYLSKKLQKLKSDMSGLNLTNLGDYNTVAQIKGLVNDFTNDPEIRPLVERSYFKQQEEKKMADAAKEGKSYYSRGYKNLMDYYNKGEYYTDNSKLGLTPGYITPEIQKTLQALKKNNTKEVMEVGRDGRNRTYNKVDGEAAAREWGQLINTDPQLNKYFSDVFEDEHKDINWEQKGKEFLLNAATQSQQLAQLDPINKEKHLQKYERYMRAANSPLLPDQFKDMAFQQYVQDKADDFGNSVDALDLKDIEADAFALDNARTGNDWKKIQWQAEKEIAVAKKKAELGIGTGGDYLRPDYDAFQNAVTSSQKRMVMDWRGGSDLMENIRDYTEEPKQYEGKKIINFTELPSNIQNTFLGFDAVKSSLKKGEKISGIIIDESDPTNKKYIPIISNSQGTDFKIAKSAGQDVIVDDNSIKLKTQQVKEEKLPGKDSPKSNTEINSKTKTSNPLELGYFQFGNDTVQAYRGNSMADAAYLKPGEKIVINVNGEDKLYEK